MHNVQYGTGIPILILHGFCVDHRFLLGLDPTFAAKGQWRRVYIDLPGMGVSHAGPEIQSADAVATAVVRFARDTFQTEKFAVLGSSFGGMIARHLAAEFGDQILGLALLCPVAVAEPSDRALPPKTVLQADPALLESLDAEDARDYAETAVIQSPENWSRFRTAVLPGLRAFDREAVSRITNKYSLTVEPENVSASFQRPTLIISGRQDNVVGFEDQIELSASYPRSTIAVLDNAGHNAHLDQPEIVNSLISEWLARVECDISSDCG